MIKSMYSAVTGLRSHQTLMDVIGNNIANVNTAGFKSSRVLFKDLFYQTTSYSSAPTANRGGTSPQQIGYGATVASVDVLNTRSGYQQTSKPLDMYISGDGYFALDDGVGNRSFSRVGSFRFDSAGNLTDSNGSFVMGQMSPLSATMPATLVKITIPTISNYTGLSISSNGTITGINSTTNAIDTLGQVALATFPNSDSLSQEGNTYLKQTTNSGAPSYVVPGGNNTGKLVSGRP
ncbi:MAG: flagellar hook-basal body complex protein [Eubacteriales bacterium]